ncbi:MAG: hypothetical protein Q9O62_05440 [Ardenticatenia bacterium]|nr:hypothetical protein [Ardenticatenia bacterium]
MRPVVRLVFTTCAILFVLAPLATFVLPLWTTVQPTCRLYAVHDEGIRNS